MLKNLVLLTGIALALVTTVSADIPIPPCDPCIVKTTPKL
jgi:hypothetical protein